MQFKNHTRFAKMAFAALTFASLLSGSVPTSSNIQGRSFC